MIAFKSGRICCQRILPHWRNNGNSWGTEQERKGREKHVEFLPLQKFSSPKRNRRMDTNSENEAFHKDNASHTRIYRNEGNCKQFSLPVCLSFHLSEILPPWCLKRNRNGWVGLCSILPFIWGNCLWAKLGQVAIFYAGVNDWSVLAKCDSAVIF